MVLSATCDEYSYDGCNVWARNYRDAGVSV